MAVTRPRHLSRLATFDAREYVADQTNRFRDIGLDYEESIAVAHRIRPNARFHSEDYPLFAGWLATRPASMVLEIGTDTGSFAAFLADLPGGHRVTTVDLPAEDRRYRRATIEDDLGHHEPKSRTSVLAISVVRTFMRSHATPSSSRIGSTRSTQSAWTVTTPIPSSRSMRSMRCVC
jgi:hypothetical protein